MSNRRGSECKTQPTYSGNDNYTIEWANDAKNIPPALGKALGAGETNTIRIVEALGDTKSAAKLCYDLN